MTKRRTFSGVDASALNVQGDFPAFEQLLYFGRYGTDFDASKANLAGGADATIVGDPMFGDNYITPDVSNGLSAVVSIAAARQALTVICTARGAALHGGLVGFHGTADQQAYLRWVTPNFRPVVKGVLLSSGTMPAPTSGFALFAMTYDGAMGRAYHTAAGGLTTNASAATGDITGDVPFRVGGFSVGATLSGEIGASVVIGAALTPSQLLRAFSYLANLEAARGVSIIN